MIRVFLSFILFFISVNALPDSTSGESVTDTNLAVQVLIEELGLRESAIASRDMEGWSPAKKIVVRLGQAEQLAAMQAVAPGVEIVAAESIEQAREEAVDAQAVLGFCDAELLSKAAELFWVQAYWAGVEGCVALPEMKSGNKLLTNAQRIGSPALAEHAIAMMMVLARGLDVYHANQLKGKWQRETGLDRADHMELEGRTLLVVGLGGIGTQVAKRGFGLGMQVIATRNSRREGPNYVEYVGLSHELNELAARADVVINTAPLTDQTRGIFDKAFFDAMKPGGYFITVGRGASTVTDVCDRNVTHSLVK